MTFSVFIPNGEAVWKTSKRIAQMKGETLGAAIYRLLENYNAENRHLLEAVERAEARKDRKDREHA